MDKTRLVCLYAVLFLVGSALFSSPVHASIQVSPSSINFGSVPVNTSSTSITITVSHTVDAAILLDQVTSNLPEFVVTIGKLPLSIPPSGSIKFQVTFRPNSAATFNGTISLSIAGTSGPRTYTISVSGQGIVPVTHLLSPSTGTLAFGSILVGASASQPVSLKNTGTGNVTVSQITVSSAELKVIGFSVATTLTPGQSLSLTAEFAPSATGSLAGSISVVSTATNSPATISVSGTGVEPQLSVVPSSVSFGSVTVGVANSQTVTLRNPGTANLTISQVTLSGTSYSVSGLTLPLSIAPGGSAAFNLSFTPASASNFAGSLSLVSNAPTSPSSIAMSGTGITKVLQLSANPAALSFGSLTTGTSTSQALTVTNTGNAAVTISQIVATGAGFSINSVSLPVSLAAGQSTSLTVTCAPVSAGSLAGSITITSNAANSPLAIALAGIAAAPAVYSVNLTWAPSASSYSGFNLYRGTASGGPYTKMNSALIPSPSYADTNPTVGKTYYYVVTEVDSAGAESPYSSQVSATIP